MISVYEDWEKVEVTVRSVLDIKPDTVLRSDKEILKAVKDALASVLPYAEVSVSLQGVTD